MSPPLPVATVDPFDVRTAIGASGVLAEFNAAGVLSAADVHVAMLIGRLSGERDEAVLLAAALAVRAPRLAHVCVELDTIQGSATSDLEEAVDLDSLDWPGDDWLARVATSPAVSASDPADDGSRPLRLEGSRLYLDRYWRQECTIADRILDLASRAVDVDETTLAASLNRLFPPTPGDDDNLQRVAADRAVRSAFSVVAGGPGTGKTTTVARIIALLDEQAMAAGGPLPRIALAAPTGKAAARLEEAVRSSAKDMDVSDTERARLLAISASTLHRLLGWRPDSQSRFRHDRSNHLPHDVVIVDETSMVSTSLMASVVDAVGERAQLILVGDPDQLASVEAGAVLGDIVEPDVAPGSSGSSLTGHITVLQRVHRFGGAIASLADAIRRGDADETMRILRSGDDAVQWLDTESDPDSLAPIREQMVAAGLQILDAATAGDAPAALQALDAMRVLCAHRRGPHGVGSWTDLVEQWLAAARPSYADGGPWYVGRPLLVTANDYTLGLYNGDTGVVVQRGDGVMAAFVKGSEVGEISPRRLSVVDTAHVMTIHKSQGSQFDTVVVVLPEPDSPILTRELLYTAVTRARRRVVVLGPEGSVCAAAERPITRATGLAARLR